MTHQPQMKPEFLVKDETELRSLFPDTHTLAVDKCQNNLDKHAREFIRRSPFLCIGTQSPDGRADVSPCGDPCGSMARRRSPAIRICWRCWR